METPFAGPRKLPPQRVRTPRAPRAGAPCQQAAKKKNVGSQFTNTYIYIHILFHIYIMILLFIIPNADIHIYIYIHIVMYPIICYIYTLNFIYLIMTTQKPIAP